MLVKKLLNITVKKSDLQENGESMLQTKRFLDSRMT